MPALRWGGPPPALPRLAPCAAPPERVLRAARSPLCAAVVDAGAASCSRAAAVRRGSRSWGRGRVLRLGGHGRGAPTDRPVRGRARSGAINPVFSEPEPEPAALGRSGSPQLRLACMASCECFACFARPPPLSHCAREGSLSHPEAAPSPLHPTPLQGGTALGTGYEAAVPFAAEALAATTELAGHVASLREALSALPAKLHGSVRRQHLHFGPRPARKNRHNAQSVLAERPLCLHT